MWRPMPPEDQRRYIEGQGSLPPAERRHPTTISDSTRIKLTIPQIVSVVVAFVGLYVSYTSQQEQTKALIEKSSQATSAKLLEVSQQLTSMQWQMKSFVTETDQRDFADDLRSANPNLKVPPFRHHAND